MRLRHQHPRDRRAARTTRPASRRSRTSRSPDVKVVVCAPEVPCGAAAQTVEEAAGVEHRAGQRGAVGDRRARQGHHRRGRRRPGLRHRRHRGRRRGRRASRSRSRRRRSTPTRSRRSPTARTRTWRRSSSTWSPATTGQQVLADAGFGQALSRGAATASRRRRARLGLRSRPRSGAAFVLLPLVAMVTAGRVEQLPRADHLGRPRSPRCCSACGRRRPARCSASSSACRWRWCWPAPASAASGSLRSLVLLPLVLPPVVGGIALLYTFGRRGLLGQTLEVLGSRSRSPPPPWCWRRPSWRCRSWWSASRARCGPPGERYEVGRRHARRPADHGLPPGDAAAGAARAGRPARCCRSPGRWASSAPRSPSPAASRA